MEHCEIARDITTLKALLPNSDWFVVSGGLQSELISIFQNRNIDYLFNGGIYGSPDDKYSITQNLITNVKIRYPVLSIGDSILDYKVAKKYGFDFVFLSEWTESQNWEAYFSKKNVSIFLNIGDICSHIDINSF